MGVQLLSVWNTVNIVSVRLLYFMGKSNVMSLEWDYLVFLKNGAKEVHESE